MCEATNRSHHCNWIGSGCNWFASSSNWSVKLLLVWCHSWTTDAIGLCAVVTSAENTPTLMATALVVHLQNGPDRFATGLCSVAKSDLHINKSKSHDKEIDKI